jgi:Sulfotransferase domain
MWSGPRNISTAMMRAWENRVDTRVIDEPFYAYYLNSTGLKHPGYEEIICSQATEWQLVAEQLSETPLEQAIYYQKHMTHHMLPEIDLKWCRNLHHCFLIRDPLLVVNSYEKKNQLLSSDDIGIHRQYQLYQQIVGLTDQFIPIIDSKDVLQNPEKMLTMVCEEFDIAFSDSMLSWPKGRRESDGIWADHWYNAVEQSTGFQTYVEPIIDVSNKGREIASQCQDDYLAMWEKRLVADY